MTALLFACASESAPSVPPADAVSDSDPAEQSRPVDAAIDRAASSPDAGAASAADPACTSLADIGSTIELSVEPIVAPAAMGGSIVDGTYVLTSGKVFTGPGGESGTGDDRSMTLRVTGSVIEIARPEGGTKGTFTVAGTTLHMSETCPKSEVTDLGYTATPTSFEIFADDDDGIYYFSFERR